MSPQHLAEAIATGRSEALPRAFWLKRRRLIRPLFDRGNPDTRTVAAGCVRLVYRVVPRDVLDPRVPAQVGFAPGRRVQNAVQRNYLRRRMREVYRKHQRALVDLFLHRGDALTLMVLFRSDPSQADACLPRDLPRALQRLIDDVAARPDAAPSDGQSPQ